MSTFQFKNFSIQQKESAMKVGTDSILLGSWVCIDKANSILDIGAGTGILALMSAQRSDVLTIDAVEIDAAAYEEAVTNFENSPWADRLFCYHSSIQEFTTEVDEKYDLIISNPPFFNPSDIQSITQRSVARQTHLLNHITLLKTTKILLSKDGTCAFVIPYEMEAFFINLAKNMGLFVYRILRTKDTETADYKRSLLQFKQTISKPKIDKLILKEKNNNYSESFIKLTKAFYKKF
jgi:tRNA1Val (adenine37-N6)-methyltransferase